MATTIYKSEVVYKTAVLHYYGFAWVASMFTLIPLGAIGVMSGMDGVTLMLMLIVGQNIQWIVLGSVLCANFRVMANPYVTPPTPREKKPIDYDIPTNMGEMTEKTRVSR